jgi:hypothetical protein
MRALVLLTATLLAAPATAQQAVTETRDPRQEQDPEFAKAYAKWTTEPRYGSPLVDHLPIVAGIPTPKDVLGYYIGQPKTLTYYADALKYYRALAYAAPARVKIESRTVHRHQRHSTSIDRRHTDWFVQRPAKVHRLPSFPFCARRWSAAVGKLAQTIACRTCDAISQFPQ